MGCYEPGPRPVSQRALTRIKFETMNTSRNHSSSFPLESDSSSQKLHSHVLASPRYKANLRLDEAAHKRQADHIQCSSVLVGYY